MLQNQKINFTLRTEVRYGMDVIHEQLIYEIKRHEKKNVFIVTDKGLMKSGVLDLITTLLQNDSVNYFTFAEVESNPTADTVMKAANLFNENSCDMILAIGGGSSIDLGKAVGLVTSDSSHILDYQRSEKQITAAIPLLFVIPTTVGSGSEVTRAAVITDTDSKQKFVVASEELTPDIAFIDPKITATLPKEFVAATSVDALVHAIEAFTSSRSTPISDGLSLKAMEMIIHHLNKSYNEPENMESRAQIQLASTMAGLAFSNAGLGLVHSCSHPMSGRFNVAHGVANAIFLPHVVSFNMTERMEKYAIVARIFKRELVQECDKVAAQKLPDILREFISSVNIPNDFSFLNIHFNEKMIDALATDAMEDKSIQSNPRKVYKEDVYKIYKKILLS